MSPESPTTPRATLLAHTLLIAVVLVWGTTFALVKAALADASPLAFNLVRMSLAALLLTAVNLPALRRLTRTDLRWGLLAGLCLGLGYQLQTAGLAHTTPTKSAFITGLVVVIVPFLSIVPSVRPPGTARPTLEIFLGAITAFTGLILLTLPPGATANILSGIGLGEALTLACAIAFAAHLIALAHAAPVTSARRLGTLQIIATAAVMLVTLPLGGTFTFHLTHTVALALTVTAVLGTAVAFTVQSWAQKHIPASHTALIVTLEPVFAWFTSLLVFGEHLGSRAMLGAGFILAGIVVAELRPLALLRRA